MLDVEQELYVTVNIFLVVAGRFPEKKTVLSTRD